jgi:hypothetical protein
MSAPTALESGALQRGIAWRARPHLPQSGVVLTEEERRSAERMSRLGREHDRLCLQACDPLEIAAVLEAAGVDDRRSRSEFQAAGVFEVAEQLWRQVPWRPDDEVPEMDRWRLPLWRAQLRGLVYALPLVLAAAVGTAGTAAGTATGTAGLAAGPGLAAGWVLVAATAGSIAAGQGLSVLGHLLTGRGQSRAVARLTAIAVTAALLLTAGGLGLLAATGRPLLLGGLAGGQLVFALSATMLMVAGADRLLLGLLAPGAAVVGASMLGVPLDAAIGAAPGTVRLAVPALTVLATALAALVRGRLAGAAGSAVGGGGEPLRRVIGWPELVLAGQAAGYGVGLSALASFSLIAVLAGGVAPFGPAIVAVSLPLTTTLGSAEYLLHRARGRCVLGLRRSGMLTGFHRGARAQLRAMVGLHALFSAVMAAVVAVLVIGGPHRGGGPLDVVRLAATVPVLDAAGYALLSVALLLATTLMSLGWVGTAARLAAVGGLAVLGVAAVPGLHGPHLAGVQLALLAGLTLLTYRITATRFTPASAHR